MNNCVSTKLCRNVNQFNEQLENQYRPSTFKFVKIGNIFEGILKIFNGTEEKNNEIDLYLKEEDEIIDSKAIENDIAVVSKDLMISFKIYDNKCRKIRRRKKQ